MNGKAAEAGNGNGGGKCRLNNQYYTMLIIESALTQENNGRWLNIMAKQRKRKYYLVPHGYGYQHGTDIIEVSMTKDEFEAENSKPYWQKQGAYFKDYMAAYYYTMD